MSLYPSRAAFPPPRTIWDRINPLRMIGELSETRYWMYLLLLPSALLITAVVLYPTRLRHAAQLPRDAPEPARPRHRLGDVQALRADALGPGLLGLAAQHGRLGDLLGGRRISHRPHRGAGAEPQSPRHQGARGADPAALFPAQRRGRPHVGADARSTARGHQRSPRQDRACSPATRRGSPTPGPRWPRPSSSRPGTAFRSSRC